MSHAPSASMWSPERNMDGRLGPAHRFDPLRRDDDLLSRQPGASVDHRVPDGQGRPSMRKSSTCPMAPSLAAIEYPVTSWTLREGGSPSWRAHSHLLGRRIGRRQRRHGEDPGRVGHPKDLASSGGPPAARSARSPAPGSARRRPGSARARAVTSGPAASGASDRGPCRPAIPSRSARPAPGCERHRPAPGPAHPGR